MPQQAIRKNLAVRIALAAHLIFEKDGQSNLSFSDNIIFSDSASFSDRQSISDCPIAYFVPIGAGLPDSQVFFR